MTSSLCRFASQFITQATSPSAVGHPAAATTNVAAFDLATLSQPLATATGDCHPCSRCGSVLSRHDASRLTRAPAATTDTATATTTTTASTSTSSSSVGGGGGGGGGGSRWVWRCQFCGAAQGVDVAPEEMPSTSLVEYVTSSPPHSAVSASAATCLVFCLDVSGSMCVTSEVPTTGRGKPKYVSRLECVQQAVTSQLAALASANKNCRVGLVTFSDDVSIFGDGTNTCVTVAGDKLNDWDQLLNIGKENAVEKPISETHKFLAEAVRGLNEQGKTALGPALLVSTGIASQYPGSRVVICTDGLANVGVGNIEEGGLQGGSFYSAVGDLANASGVSVSVVSIKGSHCSIENLGRVADATGGIVDMVDPVNLDLNFKSVLQRVVIATGVKLNMIIHPSFCFSSNTNSISIDVGNANSDTQVTFDFYSVPSVEPPNGAHCVRVYTSTLPYTPDKAMAERAVDVMVVGLHVSKKSAMLAQEGKYEQSKAVAMAYSTLLERSVHTPTQIAQFQLFLKQLRNAETEINSALAEEHTKGVSGASASVRCNVRTDRTAAMMYSMKGKEAAGCILS
ncbi:circularly permutated Ras protein 1 [Pelomyxa schiedti]|nr:circularly permutated Ras protein 1 [Pelomyxa schiedti]